MNKHVSQPTSGDKESFGPLVDRAEICRRLKVSRTTFYNMLERGQLPVIKVGGRWKMAEGVLEQYIADLHATAAAGKD